MFLTVFFQYLFKNSHIFKNNRVTWVTRKCTGPKKWNFSFQQRSKIKLLKIYQNSWLFAVFCPYFLKRSHMIKKSSWMHRLNIYGSNYQKTNLQKPLKIRLLKNWPKSPFFCSILLIFLQKIAYKTKLDFITPCEHIPDLTLNKIIFNNPGIRKLTIIADFW